MTVESLRRLFCYDDWANREALRSLQATPQASPRAREVMAHIIATEWVWMSRLQGRSQPYAVWPGWTLDDCAHRLEELRGDWEEFFAVLNEAALGREASYRNTKGESFSNTVGDVLMHVAMHGTYHRGQIAAEVRAAAGEPAYTDFIHAVRTAAVGS